MVHPSAEIHPEAQIGNDVTIGAYVAIDGPAVVGDGCRLFPHAYLSGWTRLGRGCEVYPFAALGGDPQDLKFTSCDSYVEIGDDTSIREYVTVHRGSHPGSSTRIGRNCMLMAKSHVGHDCCLGNGVILANGTEVGGHVEIGDHVFLSVHAMVHQFVRIGRRAMVGATALARHDVPPFILTDYSGGVSRLNLVGLRRDGLSNDAIAALKDAFKLLYRSGHPIKTAVSLLAEQRRSPEVQELYEFLAAESKRGIAGPSARAVRPPDTIRKPRTSISVNPIYLDNNATTPVDPQVLEAMWPYLREHFGNATSRAHAFGWIAEDAVERARRQVAETLNAGAGEIIWTSGATESNNLALKGAAQLYRKKGRHIITQATEHPAVLDPCTHLRRNGWRITVLPVDGSGVLKLDTLRQALADDTVLVSVMLANNDIGTVMPLADIGELCKQRGVLLHTDATQAFGKLPLDVQALGVDLLSFSAHKIYGPKGVGGLFVRRRNPRVRLEALFHGGGHEHHLRSGTLNVPGIVALGKAAELAVASMTSEAQRLGSLRDRLFNDLARALDGVTLNGHLTLRLPTTANISFAGIDAESLMTSIAPIAVSTGSACSSTDQAPSHVLKAIGADEPRIQGSIRFSLGRFNTEQDIDDTIAAVTRSVKELRAAGTVPS